ncbi:MAG: elongation factor P [Myxococcales bacterium]|nr:elongation factor P [Myxococcales bacterium]
MYTTSDFKKGLRIELDGQPWTVVTVTSQSPSARGASTLIKARLKNVLTGQVSDRSFKSGEKFAAPDLQMKNAQFLYSMPDEGETIYHFMDAESYEQFFLREDDLGDQANWLVENLEVRAVIYNERVCGIELPQFVEMTLDMVEPGMKGDTASGAVTTTATTTTGLKLQVPLYIGAGDVVRIDTGTGTFKDRVSAG